MFEEIPIEWRQPGSHLEVRPTYTDTGILRIPTRVLIVGQKLTAGTIGAGEIVEVTRETDGKTLAGPGSIGAAMVQAFRKRNSVNEAHFIALPDAVGAVQAAAKITLSGAITGSAVVYMTFGGARVGGKRVRFTALSGGGPSGWASNLVTAINAEVSLPLTAAVNGVNDNEVDLTFKHGGAVGNGFDIRVDTAQAALAQGMTVAISPFAGGSGNPNLQDVFDAIPNQWFTDIVVPWSDGANLALLEAECRQRYMAMSKMDMHGFCGFQGTFAESATNTQLTNSPHISCLPLNKPKSPAWVVAANLAAVATFHLTQDPARQLKSLVLTDVDGPDVSDHFTEDENNLLLSRGASTATVPRDGDVVLARIITTYRQTDLGVDDAAWLDIMVTKTLTAIRYDWISFFDLQYPRAKLIDDASYAIYAEHNLRAGTGAGTPLDNAMVAPKVAMGSWASRCQVYTRLGWVQDTPGTLEKSGFWVSPDNRNRLESTQVVNIIGNQMVLAGRLLFEAQG